MGSGSRNNPRSLDFRLARDLNVYDALGRPLAKGDQVLADTVNQVAFRVTEIKHLGTNPNFPPNAVQVTLQCTTTGVYDGGTRAGLLRVATAEELGDTATTKAEGTAVDPDDGSEEAPPPQPPPPGDAPADTPTEPPPSPSGIVNTPAWPCPTCGTAPCRCSGIVLTDLGGSER